MIRRVAQKETFHGTAAGQVPNVTDLVDRFDLTERQAQCVALLRMGNAPQNVAEVLGISTSTLENHLAELRRIFDSSTTRQLIVMLHELISDLELTAFHCWPAQTNANLGSMATNTEFAARLRGSTSVEQVLAALRQVLAAFSVRHIYYCCLPHSVQGFLRGDSMEAFLAPESIEIAFRANHGLAGQPATQDLFNAPTSVLIVPLKAGASPATLGAFYSACLDDGATHLMVLGFPTGPGFVGMALTFEAADDEAVAEISKHAETIRACAMAAHAAALTNGALAARVRLTLRERDALSALALGQRTAAAAAKLEVSERAFAKLLASARTKLKARTNAEAVGKAALINALVFL